MPNTSMMSLLLVSIAVPYGLILVLPGPNLLGILRVSLAGSTRSVALATLGIASGATLAMAAAATVASAVPDTRLVQVSATIVFSTLLLRSAIRTLRHGAGMGPDPRKPTVERGYATFWLGLIAAATNPVTVPFFASLSLGYGTIGSTSHAILACIIVFTMASTWFGTVGLICTLSPSRRLFAAAGRPLQYAIALALVGFAVRSIGRLATS